MAISSKLTKDTGSRYKRVALALLASTSVATIGVPATAQSFSDGSAVAVDPSRTVTRINVSSAADRIIESGPNEIVEVMLSDGTAISMAPNSRIRLVRYDWDGSDGILEIEILSGAARVIGGTLNKTRPIQISAAGTIMNLANGGAFIFASGGNVRASLLFGGSLAITAGDDTSVLNRAGFEVLADASGILEGPSQQSADQAFADAATINPGLLSGGASRLAITLVEDEDDGSSNEEEAIDRGQLAFPPPPPPPPPTITFDDQAVDLASLDQIGLSLGGAGSENSNGSANTGDAFNDIAYSGQGLALTNRALGGSFDYDPGCCGLPVFGAPRNGIDAFPVLTRGLGTLSGFDLLEGLVEIFPDTIEEESIVFGGETFTADDTPSVYGEVYRSGDSDRVVYLNDGQWFVLGEVPDKSEYAGDDAFVLTTFVESFDGLSSFSGASLALPISVFGADGQIKVSDVSGGLALTAFNFIEPLEFAEGAGDYAFPGDYDSAVAAVRLYLDFLIRVDPLGNPFDPIGESEFNVELQVLALQDGFFSITDGNSGYFVFLQLEQFLEEPSGISRGIIAFGNVGYGPTESSIDRFTVGRGLDDADDISPTGSPSQTLGFRAFLPTSASGEIPLDLIAQTDLYIANPGEDDVNGFNPISRLFHADLGLNEDGSASTISLTLGKFDYSGDDFGRGEDVASGRTYGSTRLASGSSTLFSSPVTSSSAGGGRDWDPGPGELDRSAVGYLVLEGYSEDEFAGELEFGSSLPLASTDSQSYSYLRLASGYDTQIDNNELAQSATGELNGFVAGAIESQTGAGNTLTPWLGSIVLNLDPVANSVGASISYGDDRTIALGDAIVSADEGFDPTEYSTYIKNGLYGAATDQDGAYAALVSGEGIKAGLGEANAAKIGDYQHVQWGFFFGDLLPTEGEGESSLRNHTALSTWVAGRSYEGVSCATEGGSVDCGLKGSATYTGHAIGSVLDGASVRTAVGSFEQTWNLDSRVGSMMLDFDAVVYTIPTLTITGDGRLLYGGDSDLVIMENAAARQARINGELVDVVDDVPQGTIGTFQIRDSEGSYQANGTFAGDIDTGGS